MDFKEGVGGPLGREGQGEVESRFATAPAAVAKQYVEDVHLAAFVNEEKKKKELCESTMAAGGDLAEVSPVVALKLENVGEPVVFTDVGDLLAEDVPMSVIKLLGDKRDEKGNMILGTSEEAGHENLDDIEGSTPTTLQKTSTTEEIADGKEEWYPFLQVSDDLNFQRITTRRRRQDAKDGTYHETVKKFLSGEGLGPRNPHGRPNRIPFCNTRRPEDELQFQYLPAFVIYHDTTRILVELCHPTAVDEEIQFVQIDLDTLVGTTNSCTDPATATIGSKIAIYGLKKRHIPKSKKHLNIPPRYRVTSFSALITTCLKPSMVAVLSYNVDFRAYDVIGSKCANGTFLEEETVKGKLKVGGFADVDWYCIPPYFVEERVDGRALFLFDSEKHDRYFEGLEWRRDYGRSEEQWRFTNVRAVKKIRKAELFSFHHVASVSNLSLVDRDVKEYVQAAFLLEHRQIRKELPNGCAQGVIQDISERNGKLEIGVKLDFDDAECLFAEEMLFRWKLGDIIQVETQEFISDQGYAPVFTITSYVRMPSGATVFMKLDREEHRIYKMMAGKEDLLAEYQYYGRTIDLQPFFPSEDRKSEALEEGFTLLRSQSTMMLDRICGLGTKADHRNADGVTATRFRNIQLDENQAWILRTIEEQRNACVVVDGPPGTGKTQLAAAFVLANSEENIMRKQSPLSRTKRIILVSATEGEVDIVLERIWESHAALRVSRIRGLKKDKMVSKRIQHLSLEFQCENAGNYIGEWSSNVNPLFPLSFVQAQERLRNLFEELQAADREPIETRSGLLAEAKKLKKAVEWEFLQYYQPEVIAMTLDTALETKNIEADILVLDDATQITIGSALALLSRWPMISKIIAFGDSKQTPFFDPSADFASVAQKSAFEIWTRARVWKTLVLNRNYRFHSGLLEYLVAPSYSELRNGINAEGRVLAVSKNLPVARRNPNMPVLLVHVEKTRRNVSTAVNKDINEDEAAACLRVLMTCVDRGVLPSSIAVVCYGTAQKELIQGNVDDIYHGEVEVTTVGCIRGQEFDVVIISTTDVHQGNSEPYKEIVSISRAREAVYVVGNWRNLSRTEFWKPRAPALLIDGALVDDSLNPFEEIRKLLRVGESDENRHPPSKTKRQRKITHVEPGFKWRRL